VAEAGIISPVLTRTREEEVREVVQAEEADCCGLSGDRENSYTYVKIVGQWYLFAWAVEKYERNARGGVDITRRIIAISGPNGCQRCLKPLDDKTPTRLYKWGSFEPVDVQLRAMGLVRPRL